MLVTLSEILKDAEERKYGVGLFNMLNLEMARGIIEAAEEELIRAQQRCEELYLNDGEPTLDFFDSE